MQNPAKEKQGKTVQQSVAQRRQKEFTEAVERVYRKYGNNLGAFLRDVQKEKELVKKG